eukprot:TRINITY_DN13898_c0_g1_i13.p1 TRINITY_DN13898_c0_g1~~TRINITY_DN13898_c0_g1_i13.p1  ORF type:complete len:106 (-),score=10.22 TRINITY_DN13898_c0_g1_i13:220-537(-)
MASVGGLIRDEDGNIILSCSINKAELLALNIGLREASRLLPQRLLVEGDYPCVIQWATRSSSPTLVSSRYYKRVASVVKRFECVLPSHYEISQCGGGPTCQRGSY